MALRLALGFVVFSCLIPYPLQLGPIRTTATDAGFVVALVIVVGALVLQPRFRLPQRLVVLLLAFVGLLVWQHIAWVVHPYGRGGIQLLWHIFKNVWYALPFPLFGFLVATAPPRTRRRFVHALWACAALSGLLGILQTATRGTLFSGVLTNQKYLGFFTPWPADDIKTLGFDSPEGRAFALQTDSFFVGPVFRAHGPYNQANAYTSSIGACTTFVVGYYFFRESAQRNWRLRVALGCTLLGMLASLGIAGMAGLLAAVGWATLLRWRFVLTRFVRGWAGLVAIALLLVGIIVVGTGVVNGGSLPEPVARRLQRLSRPDQSSGFNGRFSLWAIMSERLAAQPWFGADRPVTARDAGWSNSEGSIDNHNLYLAVAYNTGLPAAIGFVGFLLLFFQASWRVWKRGQTAEDRAFGFACHLMFLFLSVVGIANSWNLDASLTALFWLCGTICVVLALPPRRPSSSPASELPFHADARSV